MAYEYDRLEREEGGGIRRNRSGAARSRKAADAAADRPHKPESRSGLNVSKCSFIGDPPQLHAGFSPGFFYLSARRSEFCTASLFDDQIRDLRIG